MIVCNVVTGLLLLGVIPKVLEKDIGWRPALSRPRSHRFDVGPALKERVPVVTHVELWVSPAGEPLVQRDQFAVHRVLSVEGARAVAALKYPVASAGPQQQLPELKACNTSIDHLTLRM